MSRKPLITLAAAFALSSLGVSVALHAAPEPDDLIKYRKNVMKSIGGHMGAMALIMRGKVDYMPQLLDHARALAATSQDIKDIFPRESETGDTEAKPDIWKEPDKFEHHAEETEQAATAFVQAVESGDQKDLGIRFKKLGETCKSCHDTFRQKKD